MSQPIITIYYQGLTFQLKDSNQYRTQVAQTVEAVANGKTLLLTDMVLNNGSGTMAFVVGPHIPFAWMIN
jgi:DNA integrity scanning protein DisA with diadenylate cyclase activity